MLKIVKSRVYSFDNTKPVSVGDIPDDTKSVLDADMEETQISEEELARIEEENRRKKIEDDARRFNEAVAGRCNEILSARKAQLDNEYRQIVDSAHAQAEKLLADAQSKVKTVFEATEKECERLKDNAEKEGYEKGFEAGRQEALKNCEQYLEAAAKLMGEINARRESYYISHEYEMCRTVLDMVKKITMSEIKTDPSVIDRIAANAAKNFRNSDYIKISVSKGEASREFVGDKEFIRSLIPFIPEIEVEELEPEDAPEGTVVIDSGTEIIDASIPTQLEFLREIMKNSAGSAEKAEDTTEK